MRTTTSDERRYVRDLLMGRTGDVEIATLIGSHARGTSVADLSDLDLLVIGARPGPPPPTGLHVIFLTRRDVEKRARAGDDFVQWALRYGRAIKGNRAWAHLKASLPDLPWPSPAEKVRQAGRRLRRAQDLLDMGDHWAAQEELLFAVTQLSRAVLLSRGHFPLSRPELSKQLRDIDEAVLAATLEELYGTQEPGADRLHAVLVMVRERVEAHSADDESLSPRATTEGR